MDDDPDAARILREREHKRAAERARIEGEHLSRQRELDRLRNYGLGETSDPTPELSLGFTRPESIEPSAGSGRFGRGPISPEGPSTSPSSASPRDIGSPVRPPSLREFLQTNPMERFDIHALNMLPLGTILEAAYQDSTLMSAIARQADALMDRVKRELDDPLSAGAFLRDHALRWYRESPGDPSWTERTPEQWAGLFGESRVSGGRLVPWINLRLWSLREEAGRAGTLRLRLSRGISRTRKAEAFVARTPGQQIRAEVGQALLDDLAAHPRNPEGPTPLVRLSEVAVRREVTTVNEALAMLFNAPETGPFVLLHPNRYPDCDEVQIRPPSAGSSGAALAYSLVAGRGARRSGGRSHGGPEDDRAPMLTEAEGSTPDGISEIDATTIWEASVVEPDDWRRVLRERRKERQRLDPPPKDCRGRPAYAVLRDLVLEEREFRQGFLSVKWRGRPSGLPLLATLLQKGSLAPEVATDHEYLEAELGDLAEGDPHWHPPDGSWTVHGWTVRREGTHHDGFRFVAKPSG